MAFEHRTITLGETKRVSVPRQRISSKAWKNIALTKLTSFLENKVLGIKDDLVVMESSYKAPIQSQHAENNSGIVRHYQADSKYAVMVLPQISHGYDFAQLIASYFASNGVNAYYIEAPLRGPRRPHGKSMDMLLEDLNVLKLMFNQAVTEARGIVDIVSREKEKIGICGVSLGAMYSSIVYCLDERISSASLVLGGGNLAGMIFDSEDRFAKILRAKLISSGITLRTLREELKSIEPCNYTDPERSGNILMINASRDKYVLSPHAQELIEAWGNPQQHTISSGHISATVSALELLPRLLEHYMATVK